MSDYGSNLPPGCESTDGYTQEDAERAAVMESEKFEQAVVERTLDKIADRISKLVGPYSQTAYEIVDRWLVQSYRLAEIGVLVDHFGDHLEADVYGALDQPLRYVIGEARGKEGARYPQDRLYNWINVLWEQSERDEIEARLEPPEVEE